MKDTDIITGSRLFGYRKLTVAEIRKIEKINRRRKGGDIPLIDMDMSIALATYEHDEKYRSEIIP